MSAVGKPPQLDNPNLEPLDAASAFLVESAAEGLVRFDATGQIEPGLAQSWAKGRAIIGRKLARRRGRRRKAG